MIILKKIWNEDKIFQVYNAEFYIVNFCLNIIDSNHSLDELIFLKIKPLK